MVKALAGCVILVSTSLFGVGLLAALTPSHGLPRLVDALFYAVAPVAILLGCRRLCTSRKARGALAIQAFVFGFIDSVLLTFVIWTS
jgi:hypothetical protein